MSFTIEMMHYCRATLGSRCVIGNNSLHNTRGTTVGDPYYTMYEEMRVLPPPKYIQTATAEKIAASGDWRDTLQRAVDLGANMVELPAGYQTWPVGETVDGPGLSYYDQLLQANPQN